MRGGCSRPASRCCSGYRSLPAGTPYRFILLAVAMLAAVPTLYWLATARKRWAMTAVVTVVEHRAAGERRVLGHVSGGHDLHRPRVGRTAQPRAAGPGVSRSVRDRLPAPDRDRRHHPRPARPLPDVRASGGELRQGVPVHPAAAGLAGARDGARDAVRHPRRAGLQPGAAPPLLDVHPRDQLEPGLLQRLRPGAPVPAERAADGCAVRRRSEGRGGGARGPDRGRRRRLRPRAGVRMGVARLARGHVDAGRASGGRARRRPRSDVRPRAHRLRRAGSRASLRPRTRRRAPRRTERSRPRTSASR